MTRHVAGWTIAVAAAGLLVPLAGCGGKVVVPESYTTYHAKDGSFSIDYPEGWEAAGGGKGHYWAKFTSGSAEIRVETNVSGSLIGDIAGSGMGDMLGMDLSQEEMDDLSPVAKVHEFEKEQVAESLSGYEEKKPETVRSGLGDTRKAEFTASGSFGGTLKGYRATALSRDRRVRVMCKCSEDDFEALKPAFEKVIESLGLGKT